MFGRFSAAARRQDGITSKIYGASVAQARQPALYASLGVPDTMDGRFDALVLHIVLVMERLASEGDSGKALRQSLFDLFFHDMDRTLRQMGVGDLTVPKRIRAMAEMFYGRLAAYGPALRGGDTTALAQAIGRNLFPEGDAAPAAALAAYALESHQALAAAPFDAIGAGSLPFADPIRFAGTAVAA